MTPANQTSGKLIPTEEVLHTDDTREKATLLQRWLHIRLPIPPTWTLCIIIASIALAFDLYRLGVPSLWYDETFSVELARQPLPHMLYIIFGPEPNMELYYLFLKGWLGLTALFGLHATEFVVRFPSTIFAALSSVMVFLLGRRFLGLTAGIVGAGLYVLNDLQLVYAQQTRAYSMQLLLICIAWYALFAALTVESNQKRWWICFVGAMTLAVYAHLFSLLILLSQLLAFAGLLMLPSPWQSKVRRQLPALLVSLVALFVLIIPMLLVSLHGSKTDWLDAPNRSEVYNLFLTIAGQSKTYLLLIGAFCFLGLAVGCLFYLPEGKRLLDRFASGGRKESSQERASLLSRFLPVGFALVCWVVVPIVVSYVISKESTTRIFSTRYLVTIVPPIFLLVGMGVAAFRWRSVQFVLSLGLLLLALSFVPQYYQSAQVEDWRTTTFWLEQHYQPGDGLVCYNNKQGCQIPVEYYLQTYPSAGNPHFTDDSPGAYSWQTFGPADPHAQDYQAAVDINALQAYAARHTRIFFIEGRVANNVEAQRMQDAINWLDSHYHFVSQIVSSNVTIRLYVTA